MSRVFHDCFSSYLGLCHGYIICVLSSDNHHISTDMEITISSMIKSLRRDIKHVNLWNKEISDLTINWRPSLPNDPLNMKIRNEIEFQTKSNVESRINCGNKLIFACNPSYLGSLHSNNQKCTRNSLNISISAMIFNIHHYFLSSLFVGCCLSVKIVLKLQTLSLSSYRDQSGLRGVVGVEWLSKLC